MLQTDWQGQTEKQMMEADLIYSYGTQSVRVGHSMNEWHGQKFAMLGAMQYPIRRRLKICQFDVHAPYLMDM